MEALTFLPKWQIFKRRNIIGFIKRLQFTLVAVWRINRLLGVGRKEMIAIRNDGSLA